MKSVLMGLLVSVSLVACSPVQTQKTDETAVTETEPKLMRWPDLLSRPKPSPTYEIKIGEGATDLVDLWLPEGSGPHPVVVMVHGGCWQKAIADRTLMNYAAEDLRVRGLAVWNIEYRGVDEDGGGYPGTFLDVAQAVDALPEYAKQYNLDINRFAAFGHSAGGHLAVWAAARHKLPESSPLYQDEPLKIPFVVNSGGLADLEASAPITLDSCLSSIMDKLVGEPNDQRPNVFSDTSPIELLPIGAKVFSVNGKEDTIAPAQLGQEFSDKLFMAGDQTGFIQIDASGHVELISPLTKAFERQAYLLERQLKEGIPLKVHR